MNAVYRVTCCPLFKELNILPLYSQYILSLSTFIVKNTDAFKSNSAIHCIDTRQGFDLHPSTINLQNHKKQCIIVKLKFSKMCNSALSNYIKIQTDKLMLKKFLLAGFFHSCSEFFEWNFRSDLGTY